jgi:hypothetical protein
MQQFHGEHPNRQLTGHHLISCPLAWVLYTVPCRGGFCQDISGTEQKMNKPAPTPKA